MNHESGVPIDFKTESITITSASKIVEKISHNYFGDKRINSKKEFFSINPKTASKVITAISDFVDNHSYVKADYYEPLSEDQKNKLEKAGFVPSDYWATPWSEVEFRPSLDNYSKDLNTKRLNSAISKY